EAVIRLGVDADKVDQDVAQMIHRAVNFADELSGEENKHDRELLARVLLREGNVYRKAGDVTGAEAAYKQSIRAWDSAGPPRPPESGRPPPPRPPEGYAAHLALAELYLDTNRADAARAALRNAVNQLDDVWDNSPVHIRRAAAGAYEKVAA